MTMLETAPADHEATPPIAPGATATSSGGAEVQLPSLWADRPLVLVFLPPIASPFFIDNATQLRDGSEMYEEAGAAIAAVTASTPGEASAFDRQYHLDYKLLCDGERTLHAAFGLDAPDAHGSFVIDTAGAIRYAHRGGAASDYPPTSMLVRPNINSRAPLAVLPANHWM